MSDTYYLKIVGEGISQEQNDILMKAFFSAMVKNTAGKLGSTSHIMKVNK